MSTVVAIGSVIAALIAAILVKPVLMALAACGASAAAYNAIKAQAMKERS